jgi:hypothetical protein
MHTHYSRSAKWQSSWLSLPACKQANAHKQKDCTRTQRTTERERERERERVSLSVHTCRLLSGHFFRRRTSVHTLWGRGGGVVYFEFHSHLWKRKVQRQTCKKFSTLKLIWPTGYNIFSFLQTSNVEKIKIYRTVHIFPVFWGKIHQIFKTKENWKFFITFLLGIWVL